MQGDAPGRSKREAAETAAKKIKTAVDEEEQSLLQQAVDEIGGKLEKSISDTAQIREMLRKVLSRQKAIQDSLKQFKAEVNEQLVEALVQLDRVVGIVEDLQGNPEEEKEKEKKGSPLL